MTYSTTTHQGVVVEEYVTGRILRITHAGQSFKFFAQSEGKSGVAIYIGHGTLTTEDVDLPTWSTSTVK